MIAQAQHNILCQYLLYLLNSVDLLIVYVNHRDFIPAVHDSNRKHIKCFFFFIYVLKAVS